MMTKTVFINGIEEAIPAEATAFQDFIDGLNRRLSAERKVISCIKIDGQELTEGDESRLNSRALGEMGSIEVETSTPADLAYQTLDTLETYIDRMTRTIQSAAEHYK